MAEAHVVVESEEISRQKSVTCVEAQPLDYDPNERYYQDPYQSYSSSRNPYERRVVYQDPVEEFDGFLLFCL